MENVLNQTHVTKSKVRHKPLFLLRSTLVKRWFFFFACIFSGMYISVAQARNIYVTKFDDTDDGVCNRDCSLREAIQASNRTGAYDTIWLSSGTYRIEQPLLSDDEETLFDGGLGDQSLDDDENHNGDFDISRSVTIMGLSDGSTIIDGNHLDRIFDIHSGSVLLRQLTLINGRTHHDGGAIRNRATLSLWYCTLNNNVASAGFLSGKGGGIANLGTLTVNASRISGNRSGAGEGYVGQGGGIYNTGDLAVRESIIESNSVSDDDDTGSGGGLFNTGTADVRRSLFYQNRITANGNGGAMFNANGGILKVFNTTVTGNHSGEIWGLNRSGAIANGSHYYYQPGHVYIYNSTIVNNFAGGLYSVRDTHVINSILAGNLVEEYWIPDELDTTDCYLVTPQGHKLQHLILGDMGNDTCEPLRTHQGSMPANVNYEDLLVSVLQPLALNGGRTLNFAPRAGSIVIDAGSDKCPAMDQNRRMAPQDGDDDGVAVCDIGAVEFQ